MLKTQLRKFGEIIKKNLLLLVRSKSSATIVFLGPLLIVMLVGLAFSNTQSFSATAGSFSEQYSQLSEAMLDKLEKAKFNIIRFKSEAGCAASVKQGLTNICVIFPPNLSAESNTTPDLTFYVDYSRVNLVWMILSAISEEVSEQTKELSLQLTTVLLDKLGETEITLRNHSTITLGLESTNRELQKQLDDLYNSLSTLNLTISPERFMTAEIGSEIEMLKGHSMNATSMALDLVADIDSELGSANCSSTSGIRQLLNDAENSFSTLSGAILEKYTNVSFLLGALRSYANELQRNLETANAIRTRLVSDRTIRNTASVEGQRLAMLTGSISALQSSLAGVKVKEAAKIVTPVGTKIKPVTVKSTYFNYLFPTLIVLVVMLTAILLSATLIVIEKKSIAFFRNVISPTPNIMFNGATYATGLIVLAGQLLIFLTVGGLFFQTRLMPALLVTLVLLFLTCSLFIYLGMIIGYLFKTEETATLASISISFLMLFFSNTVLPIETMPTPIRALAALNPFTVAENALRQSIVFGYSFSVIAMSILWLAIYAAVLFGLTYLLQERPREQFTFYKHKIWGK